MSPQGHIGAKMRSKRRVCVRRCLTVSCGTLALLCIGVGASITVLFNYVFQEKLKEMMPLANGSMSYRGWSAPPNEISFQIWLWNVTNPKEITVGERPVLNQVGPFTFAERRFKADIQFYDNDTVSFREYQRFVYRPDLSVGNISELIITSTNMPYAVTSFRMKYLSPNTRNIAAKFFVKYSGGLFVTRTAREVLLGYKDPALKSLEGSMRYFLPKVPFQSTTGLFIGTNNTHKGVFLVHTGRGNLSNFNRVLLWKGQPALSVWPTEKANRIVGTDGSMFGPGVKPGSRLDIFSTDICLSLTLVYSSRAEVNGLPALRFVPSSDIMLNATLRPENSAFCSPGGCLDSGVLNISRCRGGIPLAISSPHFTGAPTYRAAVHGLEPNEEDYGTKIDIEPNTGFVIGAQRRMQMNIILERVPGFTDTENLVDPVLLMPLMWLNQSARIDPISAALFKAHLLAPIQMVGYAQWVLIAVGIVWVAVTALVCYWLNVRRRGHRQRKRQRMYRPPPIEDVVVYGKPPSVEHESKADSDLIRMLRDKSLPETDII